MTPCKTHIKLSGYRDANKIVRILESGMVDIADVERAADDAIFVVPQDADLDVAADYAWLRSVIEETLRSAGISGVRIELCSRLCSGQPNDSGGEQGPSSAGQAPGRAEEESPWSPPQFSLGSLMIAATAFSLACGLIKMVCVDWLVGFLGLAILGFFVWFVIGLYRLVRHS